MDQNQIQAIEVIGSTFVFSAAVLLLSRRGKISFRYTVGWFGLFALIAIGSFSILRIEAVTDLLRVSPAALVAATSFLLLLALCIQLSISISGLQWQLRKLNEDLAILKKEIDDLSDSKK